MFFFSPYLRQLPLLALNCKLRFLGWQLKYQFRSFVFNLVVLSLTCIEESARHVERQNVGFPSLALSLLGFPLIQWDLISYGFSLLLFRIFRTTWFFYQWPIVMRTMPGIKLIVVKMGIHSIQLFFSKFGLLYKFPIAALTNYHTFSG